MDRCDLHLFALVLYYSKESRNVYLLTENMTLIFILYIHRKSANKPLKPGKTKYLVLTHVLVQRSTLTLALARATQALKLLEDRLIGTCSLQVD